jgi:hypothetical protein
VAHRESPLLRCADHDLDEIRLLSLAGMKAVKDMVRNAAVVSKMAEIYMAWVNENVHRMSEGERAASAWHGMHITQGALYDLWTSSARGEYLSYESDDYALCWDNVMVNHHMCHVLNDQEWYGTGFPDPLSILEGEALDKFWGESEHEYGALIPLAVEAEEREEEWQDFHFPDSSTGDDD